MVTTCSARVRVRLGLVRVRLNRNHITATNSNLPAEQLLTRSTNTMNRSATDKNTQ